MQSKALNKLLQMQLFIITHQKHISLLHANCHGVYDARKAFKELSEILLIVELRMGLLSKRLSKKQRKFCEC